MRKDNVGQFTGEVMELKELARKSDGSVWGYSAVLGQMGAAVEFILPDFKTFQALKPGDQVTAVYHLEQNGYDIRVRVDEVRKADDKPKTNAA